MTEPATKPVARRIESLDVLRGVAICGILLVNIQPVTHFSYETEHARTSLADASGWLQLLVQQRFFPIFSLLFGISFALLLRSAERRSARPRLLLARRLLVLLPIGVLHQWAHPGEALSVYAVVGLVVLLPASWLPRWVVAIGSVLALGASLVLTGGGVTIVPGMFLLGAALVRFGLIDRMERSRAVPVLFAIFAIASVPAAAWQLQDLVASGFSLSSAVAGLTMAGAYCTGIVLLMRARSTRAGLTALFAPLGRTALTCYITATPLLLLAGAALDLPHEASWTPVLAVCAAILVGQWITATVWLRYFRQGPLEWLWRCATWGEMQPLRRSQPNPSPDFARR